MNKVYFCNNGRFDIKAMMTFGVSAKSSDDCIGYFGTGFKYAIAIILRIGGSIKLTTNGEAFEFKKQKETIRGKEFDIVYMNDREAGFTTHLGINWQPWMAFRELYCNCIDESGEISNHPLEYETVIEIDCPLIAESYRNRDDYILSGKPVYSTASVDIYEKPKPYIYYKGIAVMQITDAIFGYNIKDRITLTEDRTVQNQYEIRFKLQKLWQSLNDFSLIKKIVTSKQSFESGVGFDIDYPVSDEFVECCKQLQATDSGISTQALNLISKLDEKKGDWPEFFLSKTQLMMLEKAKKFLLGIGISIDDFPIKTVTGLGDGVMGRAHNCVIYLSSVPFQMGTKQVASTLIEEWVHNKHGCSDFDRKMQSWLFDKILSIGEELNGEPL